jgi:hypothetical protein
VVVTAGSSGRLWFWHPVRDLAPVVDRAGHEASDGLHAFELDQVMQALTFQEPIICKAEADSADLDDSCGGN